MKSAPSSSVNASYKLYVVAEERTSKARQTVVLRPREFESIFDKKIVKYFLQQKYQVFEIRQ